MKNTLIEMLTAKIKACADADDLEYDGDMGPAMHAQQDAGIDLDDFVQEYGRELVATLEATPRGALPNVDDLVERYKALRVKYHSLIARDDFEDALPADYDGPIITAIQVANEIDFVASKIVQALPPEERANVIEECAAICDRAARTYRSMKVDEDGVVTEDSAEAEEMAYCSELNAKEIRKLKAGVSPLLAKEKS